MKNKLLIIIVFFILSIICFSSLTITYADEGDSISIDGIIDSTNSFLDKGKNNNVLDDTELQNFSNFIFNTLLAIGMVVAVAIGSILGIKFMISTVEEKANIKKILVPYVIGCIVLFGAFEIWKVTVTIMQEAESVSTNYQGNIGEETQNPESGSSPGQQSGGETQEQKPRVTGIKISKTNITINTDKTYQLSASLTGIGDFDKSIVWTSLNPSIAKVSKNGKVKGVGVGKAIIVAKSSSNSSIRKQCSVTVQSSVSSKTKMKLVSNFYNKGYSQTVTLGKRNYKLYRQGGVYYSNDPFNSTSNKTMGSIALNGCGPTSLAIILSGYGYNYNPSDVGKKLLKNNPPASLENMAKELKAMGRNVIVHSGYSSNYNKVYKKMRTALANDHKILLYVGKDAPESTYKKFTSSGYHFISILAIDLSNDKVFVGNPNTTNTGWNNLSTVVKARGFHHNPSMVGWLEIY